MSAGWQRVTVYMQWLWFYYTLVNTHTDRQLFISHTIISAGWAKNVLIGMMLSWKWGTLYTVMICVRIMSRRQNRSTELDLFKNVCFRRKLIVDRCVNCEYFEVDYMHAYRMAWPRKMRAQTWPQTTVQHIIIAMLSMRVLPRRPITTGLRQITISESFFCCCMGNILCCSVLLKLLPFTSDNSILC